MLMPCRGNAPCVDADCVGVVGVPDLAPTIIRRERSSAMEAAFWTRAIYSMFDFTHDLAFVSVVCFLGDEHAFHFQLL